MKYKYTMTIYNSKIDKYGNCYWAFCFVDHASGEFVTGRTGTVGESNLRAMARHWDVEDDWDRSILFHSKEMGKRDFKRMTECWSYVTCDPSGIALFIRNTLKERQTKN